MKPQPIIVTLTAVSAIIALFVWGYTQQSPTVNVSAQETGNSSTTKQVSMLSASETFYDFGTISMKDGNVQKDFTVSNLTDQDVLIPSIVTSCMCTEALLVEIDGTIKGTFGMPGHGGAVPPANELIKAGESRTIRVVYDPNAHGPAGVGKINRTVTLTDESGTALQLEIQAVVTP